MPQLTPRLTLTDDGGTPVDLWITQEDNRKHNNKVDDTSVIGMGPGETLLVNLEQEQEVQLSGKLPFRYLANNESAYSNDYRTAGAEWIQEVAALMEAQGPGNSLEDKHFDETVTNVYVTEFRYSMKFPEIRNISWAMTLKVGQGVTPFEDITPKSPTPTNSASVGGYSLPGPTRLQGRYSVETETTPTPLPESAEDNIITPNSGLEHTITVEGKTKNPNTFDSNIRSLLGTGKTYTYSSAFPGLDFNVMVNKYNPKGNTNHVTSREYSVEMIEGTL